MDGIGKKPEAPVDPRLDPVGPGFANLHAQLGRVSGVDHVTVAAQGDLGVSGQV